MQWRTADGCDAERDAIPFDGFASGRLARDGRRHSRRNGDVALVENDLQAGPSDRRSDVIADEIDGIDSSNERDRWTVGDGKAGVAIKARALRVPSGNAIHLDIETRVINRPASKNLNRGGVALGQIDGRAVGIMTRS